MMSKPIKTLLIMTLFLSLNKKTIIIMTKYISLNKKTIIIMTIFIYIYHLIKRLY
jgi:hypothetical protein